MAARPAAPPTRPPQRKGATAPLAMRAITSLLLLGAIASSSCAAGSRAQAPPGSDLWVDVRAYATEAAIGEDEARRRLEMRRALVPAIEIVEASPNTFGGGYFTDQGDSWRYVILFVDGSQHEASRAQVEELLPVGAPVEWREVKYSWATLSGITTEIPNVLSGGGFVHAVGPNIQLNRVEVFVSEENADFAADLAARYGDAVAVIVQEPPRPI